MPPAPLHGHVRRRPQPGDRPRHVHPTAAEVAGIKLRFVLPAHGDHPVGIDLAAREQHPRHVRVDRDRRGQKPPGLGRVAPLAKRGERPAKRPVAKHLFLTLVAESAGRRELAACDQQIEVHEPGPGMVVGVEGGEELALGDRLRRPAHDRQTLRQAAVGQKQPPGLHHPPEFAHVPLDHGRAKGPLAGRDAEAILPLRGMDVVRQLGQEHVGPGTVGRELERLAGDLPRPLGLEPFSHLHERLRLGEGLGLFRRPAAADRDPLPPLVCDRVGKHVEHADEFVRCEQSGVLTLIAGHFRWPSPPGRSRGLGPPVAAAGWFLGVGVFGAPVFAGVASGHERRV